jgi:peptidoglycan/xylan/chitin deacetylase (PgdA/CDA1 family)
VSNKVSIIMYHYVRDLSLSGFPLIKGRELRDFITQLEYIKSNYTLIGMHDLANSVRYGSTLPPNAALLTFDDGYLDHFVNVFPLLFDAGLSGAFFPPVGAIERGELLDVNRIHFILAAEQNHDKIADLLDDEVQSYGRELGLKSSHEYRKEWAKGNRFDPATTIYIKRMLQRVLPQTIRNRIAIDLFRRFVSVDEASFASSLYCSKSQLKMMQSSGMYIGSHGDEHVWLDSVDEVKQLQEVDVSLSFLRSIGSPVDDYWVMCYPYGAWNESLLGIIKRRLCTIGLTTEVDIAQIGNHDSLKLPRLDTNDIPIT